MSITWADVVELAPDLSTTTVAAQNLILAHVALQVGPTQWGTYEAMGQLYLAAHLGTLQARGGSAAVGPVTSETVGPVSRSYGSTATAAAGLLNSTPYGSEYARLRALLPTRFGMVL